MSKNEKEEELMEEESREMAKTRSVEEMQDELNSVSSQLEEMKRIMSNADELLTKMLDEQGSLSGRITKLQTLRKTRSSKP